MFVQDKVCIKFAPPKLENIFLALVDANLNILNWPMV